MNYEKIYKELVESRKLLNRKRSKEVYYENHHIVPKSLGGTNDKANLVLLTAKEHFLAHLLLIQIYTGVNRSKMVYALWRFTIGHSVKRKPISSGKQYEIAKQLVINERKGKKHSKETIEKRRNSLTGLKRSDEIRKKFSEVKKGITSKLKGRTYKEIYGEDKIAEQKNKRKQNIIGKTLKDLHSAEKIIEIKSKQKISLRKYYENNKEEFLKRYETRRQNLEKKKHEGKIIVN